MYRNLEARNGFLVTSLCQGVHECKEITPNSKNRFSDFGSKSYATHPGEALNLNLNMISQLPPLRSTISKDQKGDDLGSNESSFRLRVQMKAQSTTRAMEVPLEMPPTTPTINL